MPSGKHVAVRYLQDILERDNEKTVDRCWSYFAEGGGGMVKL